MTRRTALFVALVSTFASSEAAFAANQVAVAPISAPAKSGGDKVEAAIRSQLESAGLSLLSDKALQKSAKKLKADPTSPKVAKDAGAALLVTAKVTKTKKGFQVEAKLFDAATGKTLKTSSKSYGKPTGAGGAGSAIGKELAEAASSAVSAEEEETPKPKSRAVQPKDETEDATPSVSTTPTPKEEPKAEVVTPRPEKQADASGPERKMLRFSLGAGSQLTSAYTVTVGDAVTGLAYDLSPLLLAEVGARFLVPSTGLSFGLGFAYVPVKYDIQVDPPVTPTTPSGSFMDLVFEAAYQLDLTTVGSGGSLYLAPVLGFHYASLSVDAQTPFTVVLGDTRIAPQVGAIFGVGLGDLAIEAHAKLDLVLSYKESPETTGQDGSGIGLDVGATGRYWLVDPVGLYLSAAYQFAKISTTGPGTRTPFATDPPLQDAAIFSGRFRVGVGAVFAL